MKLRTFLLLIALVIMTSVFGQSLQNVQTKTIAILETVDKEEIVPYGVKLMVRSKLSDVITATSGYEAYDRVDIASIMNEQEFQRTGLVSDSQIKRLGEMTGADYILVAEVAQLDYSHIIIVAKILNVETAQVDKTSNIQTETDVEAMDEACRELAARLLGIQRGKTITF